MKKFKILLTVIVLALAFLIPVHVFAQSDSDKYKELQSQIDDLTQKLNEVQDKARTLTSQITYMDNQIKLTALKISETEGKIADTEKEIEKLQKKIEKLEGSLTKISEVLLERVAATYKSKSISPVWLLLSSDGFSEVINKAKYLQLVQAHDKKLMFEIQSTKTDFEEEKTALEEKKKELDLLKEKLDSQKVVLDQQKKDKQSLLDITRNDEKRYQELLEKAIAEQSAIEKALKSAILQLKDGSPIDEGKEIALMGNTGYPSCSTGSHLHFEVTKDGVRQNPADYLKQQDVVWDNSPDGSFSFNGDWSWPMDNPRITQGYGMTYWARTGFYGGSPHTGIDIVSSNPVIKAPKSGTLYKGSATCGSSRMNYVAIDHGGGIISWYWHVQ